MRLKATAIVSCFGLPGLILAFIFGEKSIEARYYMKQSANFVICSIAVLIAYGIFEVIITFTILISLIKLAVSLYHLAILLQILISAINLEKPKIYGLIWVIY